MLDDDAIKRWGLYATHGTVTMWAITEGTFTHPDWWPAVWSPFPAIEQAYNG